MAYTDNTFIPYSSLFRSAASITSSRSYFFNDTATTEIYTLSLHDALPIYLAAAARPRTCRASGVTVHRCRAERYDSGALDRKSTRLNSSHSQISYAVFCLKKKKGNLRLLRSEEHKSELE